MADKLIKKRIAFLMTHGFEKSEFQVPYSELKKAGASIDIISLKSGNIRSWKNKDWSKKVPVDKKINEVFASSYDALILPGGVMNPDQLRLNPKAISFVTEMINQGKPVAAICHGPWLLIETGLIKGIKITSYPSLKTDLTNAGAIWLDQPVVVDNGIITSRNPDDLAEFCREIKRELLAGINHKDISGNEENKSHQTSL